MENRMQDVNGEIVSRFSARVYDQKKPIRRVAQELGVPKSTLYEHMSRSKKRLNPEVVDKMFGYLRGGG